MVARDYYGEPMAGFSIPAAEHSTITSWGRDHEVDAMRNMLEQYPSGLVAVVSDSFDIFEACEQIWGGTLREQVLAARRLRGDSPRLGRPAHGAGLRASQRAGDSGRKVRIHDEPKGYKVLDPHVRHDPGRRGRFRDARRASSTPCKRPASRRQYRLRLGRRPAAKTQPRHLGVRLQVRRPWSSTGGSATVYKRPVTDRGKQSKSGRMKLVRISGPDCPSFRTVRLDEPGDNELVEVFRDGTVLRDWTFSEIRDRRRDAV